MVSDELRIALGAIEVSCRRGAPDGDNTWLVRVTGSAAARRVPHAQLLETLQRAGVDMQAFEVELHALLATQVTFAELVLRNAARLLGAEQAASTQAARRELRGLLWLALQELDREPPGRHLTLVT